VILTDLRHGLRLIRSRPSFALIAIVTLAVGIGSTTATFAVVDRVILRSAPFPEPNRLVVVWETNPTLTVPVMVASPPTLHDWQTRHRSFDSIGAFRWRNMTVSGGGEPEQVRGALITASLLRVLAVQPERGRFFFDDEDRPGAPPVVLISDGLWRRRFGGSAGVLGQHLSLDGVSREIVGVMPPGYHAPPPVVIRGLPPVERADVWIPLAVSLPAGRRNAHNLTVVARLNTGVTLEAADSDIKRIAADVAQEDPAAKGWDARVVPLAGWVTETSRRSVTMLAVAVGFVLLLACANVANLLLGRGVGRRREFAIRAALGASRARLATQVIGETLVLALLGGVAGAALAAGLIQLIVTRGPATIPGIREVTLDGRAVAFAMGISVVSAVLAGIVPAARAMAGRVADRLTDRGTGPGHGAIRVQKALVIGQVALAMALLVSAGLLVESFRQLRAVDPGFRPKDVVTGKVLVPEDRYPDEPAMMAFVDRLLSSARRLPGVSAVALSDGVPLADDRQGTSFVRPDAPAALSADESLANFTHVTESYFEALGVRLIAGRTFTELDRSGHPGVIVINERLARQRFGTDNPIRRFAQIKAAGETPIQIVGVVADDHHAGVDSDPTPTFFLPFRQTPGPREVALIVRTEGDAVPVVAALRSAISALDPQMPFYRVRTLEEIVNASVATPRSLAWLLSGFSLSGLLLAAIGVFGVLSQAVTQRTPEIGVRLALGATPGQVLWMVLREGLVQVGIGIALGLAIAIVTARLLSGLLFGVTTTDVTPYVAVAGLLLLATIAACLAPGLRAMRVDPVASLRAE
jgi:putative ABC transport system permease protein